MNEKRPKELVASETIKDCRVCFDVKEKPPDLGIEETNAINKSLSGVYC